MLAQVLQFSDAKDLYEIPMGSDHPRPNTRGTLRRTILWVSTQIALCRKRYKIDIMNGEQ